MKKHPSDDDYLFFYTICLILLWRYCSFPASFFFIKELTDCCGSSGSEGMCYILYGPSNFHSWRSVGKGAGHMFATASGKTTQ